MSKAQTNTKKKKSLLSIFNSKKRDNEEHEIYEEEESLPSSLVGPSASVSDEKKREKDTYYMKKLKKMVPVNEDDLNLDVYQGENEVDIIHHPDDPYYQHERNDTEYVSDDGEDEEEEGEENYRISVIPEGGKDELFKSLQSQETKGQTAEVEEANGEVEYSIQNDENEPKNKHLKNDSDSKSGRGNLSMKDKRKSVFDDMDGSEEKVSYYSNYEYVEGEDDYFDRPTSQEYMKDGDQVIKGDIETSDEEDEKNNVKSRNNDKVVENEVVENIVKGVNEETEDEQYVEPETTEVKETETQGVESEQEQDLEQDVEQKVEPEEETISVRKVKKIGIGIALPMSAGGLSFAEILAKKRTERMNKKANGGNQSNSNSNETTVTNSGVPKVGTVMTNLASSILNEGNQPAKRNIPKKWTRTETSNGSSQKKTKTLQQILQEKKNARNNNRPIKPVGGMQRRRGTNNRGRLQGVSSFSEQQSQGQSTTSGYGSSKDLPVRTRPFNRRGLPSRRGSKEVPENRNRRKFNPRARPVTMAFHKNPLEMYQQQMGGYTGMGMGNGMDYGRGRGMGMGMGNGRGKRGQFNKFSRNLPVLPKSFPKKKYQKNPQKMKKNEKDIQLPPTPVVKKIERGKSVRRVKRVRIRGGPRTVRKNIRSTQNQNQNKTTVQTKKAIQEKEPKSEPELQPKFQKEQQDKKDDKTKGEIVKVKRGGVTVHMRRVRVRVRQRVAVRARVRKKRTEQIPVANNDHLDDVNNEDTMVAKPIDGESFENEWEYVKKYIHRVKWAYKFQKIDFVGQRLAASPKIVKKVGFNSRPKRNSQRRRRTVDLTKLLNE